MVGAGAELALVAVLLACEVAKREFGSNASDPIAPVPATRGVLCCVMAVSDPRSCNEFAVLATVVGDAVDTDDAGVPVDETNDELLDAAETDEVDDALKSGLVENLVSMVLQRMIHQRGASCSLKL